MIHNFDNAAELAKGGQPPSNVLVIDDQKIRLAMFANTAALLKKINKLEKDYEAFQNQDQRLYDDWCNLTFRIERQQEEQLDRRLQNLRVFKTHVDYLVEASNVSPNEAYLMLQDEEKQYQSGDEDWRFVIEMLRQQRLENAKKIKNQGVSENIANFSGHLFQEEEAGEVTALTLLNRKERTTFYFIKEMREEVLARRILDTKTGFSFFKESFQVAMKSADWNLLAKLWKCSHRVFQDRLLKNMPVHLQDFLLQMIKEQNEKADSSTKNNLAEDLFIKASYRKLVRLLHPDTVLDVKNFERSDWFRKTWQKVQDAYQKKDRRNLQRLEYMVLLQLGHLNSLTMDEIYESSLLFDEELDYLKKKIRSFRRHPAWGFSSRRDYASLTCKTRQILQSTINSKLAELEGLEAWVDRIACTAEA